MLYVTVGLATMFGVLAVLGLNAIDQATQLVYRERLATAHTTAGIFERDLDRVAGEIIEVRSEPSPGFGSGTSGPTAGWLLARYSASPELSPFFSVSGVWLLDEGGELVDAAGEPRADDPATRAPLTRLRELDLDDVTLLPGVRRRPGGASVCSGGRAAG